MPHGAGYLTKVMLIQFGTHNSSVKIKSIYKHLQPFKWYYDLYDKITEEQYQWDRDQDRVPYPKHPANFFLKTTSAFIMQAF